MNSNRRHLVSGRRALGAAALVVAVGLVGTSAEADPRIDPVSGPTSGGQEVTLSGLVLDVTRDVSGGGTHSLAIGVDGTVYAWGSNGLGQLGDATLTDSSTPVVAALPDGVHAVDISAGGTHSLAAGSDGAVYAWGDNTFAQLGNAEQGPGTEESAPVRVDLPDGVRAESVSAGARHSLAVGSDGAVYAWGLNNEGQLGDGTAVGKLVPVRVERAPGVRALAVAAGDGHSLAVGSDGLVYAWGGNGAGQLGTGTTDGELAPVAVDLGPDVSATAVAAGFRHSLAVGSDGTVYSWGDNGTGELGIGSLPEDVPFATTPQAVTLPAGARATSVSAGFVHSLARTDDGRLYSWGENFDGQLGTGTPLPQTSPALVDLPDVDVIAASAGAEHSLAVGVDGAIYAWGNGESGRLGNGEQANQPLPIEVDQLVLSLVPAVYFGDVDHPGTDVTVDASAGTVRAVTPAHPAGTVDVSLRLNAVTGLGDPIGSYTFLAVPNLGADGSSITATPAELVADGTSTSRIVVQLVDTTGLPITGSGEVVDISVIDGPGVVSETTPLDDGTFEATFTAGIDTAVTTVGFTVDGVRADDTARITVTAPEVGVHLEHATREIGQAQTVTGTGFLPNETVRVVGSTNDGAVLVTADADGAVSHAFTVPEVAPGTRTITLTGVTSDREGSAEFVVTRSAASPSPSPSPTDDDGRPLPSTGANPMAALLPALLAAAVGTGLVLRSRRTRRTTR